MSDRYVGRNPHAIAHVLTHAAGTRPIPPRPPASGESCALERAPRLQFLTIERRSSYLRRKRFLPSHFRTIGRDTPPNRPHPAKTVPKAKP